MMQSRFLSLALYAAVLMMCNASIALAQTYPSGPVRLIVPFPPGGGTDILARSIAQKLNEAWGVSLIVDNRGGANGTIGAAVAAKAAPDGHTVLIVPSGFAVNPSIYKNLPFDSLKDFAPVTQLAASPLVMVVHPSFPVKSVKELITFVKARPNEINYGSSGNGSPPHIATELFKLMTGIKMTHIAYKGAGPAAIDVIAGHIPIYFMNALQATPHIKGGRLRPLGVTSDKRHPGLPDVPTIAEAGVPGYAMTNWYGMLVPAGTPRASLMKLHAEVVRILNLPELKERLASEGAAVVAGTPEQFAAFLKSEMATAAKIVQASGMTSTN
ncbi:MAG TPA: tripartite tricarboxylate transporter substrate binding protein [Burkholderiales bacterium]|nr:tripartite tricarboxylate transporter substrate binding protein [Burkholderiales bacterium]